ncbi:hypothetical protein FGO68_gene7303 [Halteria grandinella]|uniref:Uncharacterized protein n=1 Tax=Halteria grandinella TaxID=5974 RepID=A0A8J8P3V6_HALGN|nr:hypothetical protein FGO68_gene7303 [Halteria grandinella]
MEPLAKSLVQINPVKIGNYGFIIVYTAVQLVIWLLSVTKKYSIRDFMDVRTKFVIKAISIGGILESIQTITASYQIEDQDKTLEMIASIVTLAMITYQEISLSSIYLVLLLELGLPFNKGFLYWSILSLVSSQGDNLLRLSVKILILAQGIILLKFNGYQTLEGSTKSDISNFYYAYVSIQLTTVGLVTLTQLWRLSKSIRLCLKKQKPLQH